MAARHVHASSQQQQDQDRQHDLEIVDQPVTRLRLDQVRIREQGERRVDARDFVDDREAAVDQVLLNQVDERPEVEYDLAVAGSDRPVALPGERFHHRLMDAGVGLDPQLSELRACHDRVYLAVDESVHRAADLRGDGLQQRSDARQPFAVQGRGGLIGVRSHVELARDLSRDLVGQRVLNGRLVDEWLHVGHVTIGVGDLIGAPDPQHRDRSEQAAKEDKRDGHQGPPANAPTAAVWRLLGTQLI